MSKRAMLILLTCAALLLFLAPAGALAATTWSEDGDAGDLLDTAQNTGGGSLSAISGEISDINDNDLFQIYIYDPASFSACAISENESDISDTVLWLFDANGMPVIGNDDTYLYENAVNFLALKWFPYGPVVSTSEIEKICIRGLYRWPWGFGKADNWWCS